MMRRILLLMLMAVFVMSSGVVLANGKKSVDGQKQIGEATAEVALTVIRTTTDDSGMQEEQNQIGLTEINQSMQVAFIHAPTGDANADTSPAPNPAENSANDQDQTATPNTQNLTSAKIEIGCYTAMFFGSEETEVATSSGATCAGQVANT